MFTPFTLRGTVNLYARPLGEKAVTASNIFSDIDGSREFIDRDLPKLPPCTIERKVAISDVEYPIVHSHSIPGYVEWDDSWAQVNPAIDAIFLYQYGL